jgi:D-sedoheptulose 7-phosphate isomerase
MIAYKELIKEINYTQKILDLLKYAKIKKFDELCKVSINALKKGKKIILFGNGGSAADSQHLATELTVRFKKNRKAFAALSLATDTSAITAIGNDFNFNFIFSRQLQAIGKSGDIAIAITTSGNSQNIIEAIKIAKKKKILIYSFCGNDGGKVKNYTKNIILVPSKETSTIQTIQILIGQVFCKVVEDNLS